MSQAEQRQEELPEGCALGPDGKPTRDAAEALAGAQLAFGGMYPPSFRCKWFGMDKLNGTTHGSWRRNVYITPTFQNPPLRGSGYSGHGTGHT